MRVRLHYLRIPLSFGFRTVASSLEFLPVVSERGGG
jgi:hypothetical protein